MPKDNAAYKKLETIFAKINDLSHLQSIAGWDEAVMMPAGGGKARAKALATLKTISHQTLTNPEVGELIKQAHDENLDAWQQANLKLIEKKYINATCLPEKLVRETTEANLHAEQAWRELRAENNWQDFLPLLEKNVSLAKESATIRSERLQLSPYDILLDDFSPGILQEHIDPVFTSLRETLPPLIDKIIAKQQSETIIPIQGPFPTDKQKQLGLDLMQAIGFDFNHGRLDVSHHPFCGGVPQDVRITTRYKEDEFVSAAMGTCHETGHARYEQGLPTAWLNQPVGQAPSMALHESQSLLVEMQACRSLEFMSFLSPLIERHFSKQEAINPHNLFRLYTKVERSYIRVDADEVTYPLHIMLRYELEKSLFSDALAVSDLPEAWNQAMLNFFDLSTEDNYKDGVMQDVHWAAGLFGYFPSYTLGSLTAAQLFTAAKKEQPEIISQLHQGNFSTLFAWLNQHVHQRASSVSYDTLLKDATGTTLNPQFFIDHIDQRYLKN